MIIDVHGHYTTAPRQLAAWRQRQIASAGVPFTEPLVITDDEIRETIATGQLRLLTERGTDLTLFSPTAGGMAHHYGDETTSLQWTTTVNDLIHRVCDVCSPGISLGCASCRSRRASRRPTALPSSSAASRNTASSAAISIRIRPTGTGPGRRSPISGGIRCTSGWSSSTCPAMIHVSMSCNPNFHGTGAHYLNGDTSAFMQLVQADLFKDFPTLKFVIPHGGGAVPYHWGRYRGIAQDAGRPPIEGLLDNVFFDTCVYHYPGVRLLVEVIGADNVVFASEMIGAVRGVDARSGHYFDDTKRYVDAIEGLSAADRQKIYEGNALRIYPRLARALATR